MNYHNIIHDDQYNGDGIREVLFCSGCTHCCPGCQNSQTWDKESGIEFDTAAKEELFDRLSRDYISGVTLSGGDPLAPYNREEMLSLAEEIKEKFPDKTVWIYTGFTKDELIEQGIWDRVSKVCDVLVEGRFEKDKASEQYPWAGSTNQKVLRKDDGFLLNTSDPVYVACKKLEAVCSVPARNHIRELCLAANNITQLENGKGLGAIVKEMREVCESIKIGRTFMGKKKEDTVLSELEAIVNNKQTTQEETYDCVCR